MAPRKRPSAVTATTPKSTPTKPSPSTPSTPTPPTSTKTPTPHLPLPSYLLRCIFSQAAIHIVLIKSTSPTPAILTAPLPLCLQTLIQNPIPTLSAISFGLLIIQFAFGVFLRERWLNPVAFEGGGKKKKGFFGAWKDIVDGALKGKRPKWEEVQKRTNTMLKGVGEGDVKPKKNVEENMLFVLQGLAMTLASSVIFHLIAILLGASLYENVLPTFLLSTLLSVLSIFPIALAIPISDRYTWLRLFSLFSPRNSVEIALLYPAIGSIVGCWLGALPIPLDWDRDWQKWPTTCVVGTVVGHSIVTSARNKNQYCFTLPTLLGFEVLENPSPVKNVMMCSSGAFAELHVLSGFWRFPPASGMQRGV